MINPNYKYSDITGKVIGCAMRVHSALGNGFQEVIYQRALAIEMEESGISFSREHTMPIYYRNQQIGTRRVDFLVEGVVSVEIKAITTLDDSHLAQQSTTWKHTILKWGCSSILVPKASSINGLLIGSLTKRIRGIRK